MTSKNLDYEGIITEVIDWYTSALSDLFRFNALREEKAINEAIEQMTYECAMGIMAEDEHNQKEKHEETIN